MSSFILKQISNKISNELFLEALELIQTNITTLESKDIQNIFTHITAMDVPDLIIQNYFDVLNEHHKDLLNKKEIINNLIQKEKWEFLAINDGNLKEGSVFLQWSIISGYESVISNVKKIDLQKNENIQFSKNEKDEIELELSQQVEKSNEKVVDLFSIKGLVPSYSEEILETYKNKLIETDNKFALEQAQLSQKQQKIIKNYAQKFENCLNHLSVDKKELILTELFEAALNKDNPLLLEEIFNNDKDESIKNKLKNDSKLFSSNLELLMANNISKETILTLLTSVDLNDKVSKPDHNSPILLAVKHGRVDLIHGIVDTLYHNQKENFLAEAMVKAAQNNQVECMQQIRQMGIPFHLTNKITGDSLLHYAVKAGAERTQKFLLKRGLKMNISNSFGVSPQMLHEAISEKLKKPILENSGNVIPLFKK